MSAINLSGVNEKEIVDPYFPGRFCWWRPPCGCQLAYLVDFERRRKGDEPYYDAKKAKRIARAHSEIVDFTANHNCRAKVMA